MTTESTPSSPHRYPQAQPHVAPPAEMVFRVLTAAKAYLAGPDDPRGTFNKKEFICNAIDLARRAGYYKHDIKLSWAETPHVTDYIERLLMGESTLTSWHLKHFGKCELTRSEGQALRHEWIDYLIDSARMGVLAEIAATKKMIEDAADEVMKDPDSVFNRAKKV